MSREAFTPGPWFVSRDPRPDMEWNNHVASVAQPHIEICSMFHTNEVDDNETGEANAVLVAAAPELLTALRSLLPEGWDDGTMDHMPGVKAARLALAKATGKGAGE